MMPLPAGVRLHHAGIDGKTLATDQAFLDTEFDHLLEEKEEDLLLGETTVPVL